MGDKKLSPEQETALAALLGSGFTVRDALEHAVALRALSNLVAERDGILRGFLEAEAKRIEAETGAPMKVESKGVGSAYVTQPEERLVVVEEAEWIAWLAERYPDRVSTRSRVLGDVVARLVEEEPDLAERLRAAGAIVDEPILGKGLEAEVLATTGRTRSGGIVDPDTGFCLPALAAKPKGNLTVRPDSKAVARAVAGFRSGRSIELPALPEPVEVEA